MPSVRAATLLAAISSVAILAACAGNSQSPDAPEGVSLAGNWKLDPAASDDPQKVLAKMRAQAERILARRRSAPPPVPSRRGGAGGSPEEQSTDEELTAQGPGGQRPDPLKRSPMAHVILAVIARGDFLTVRQSATQMVFDYGTSQRSFTPGARSVVSAEGGVGDQVSGWHGREYVIHVRAQQGPDTSDSYGLSADGHELIEKLHIGAAELPAEDLTRVYRPTSEIAPRMLPNND
jgi:hypothetical protein